MKISTYRLLTVMDVCYTDDELKREWKIETRWRLWVRGGSTLAMADPSVFKSDIYMKLWEILKMEAFETHGNTLIFDFFLKWPT